MKANIGFDGRVFLTEPEWQTYIRRMPVRYIRKPHNSDVCSICGLPASPDNPLEHSHKIAFRVGVAKFALTPDFLDSAENIVSAHKRMCNRAAELSDEAVSAWLRVQGHTPPPFAPAFNPNY